jgi:hypothetical protein
MLKKIEEWIDGTLVKNENIRISCERFALPFNRFYSREFLSKSYFVIVEDIPRPNFPELRQAGLSEIIDMEINGITYKNTYFIKEASLNDLRLHFHELVHVAQWHSLGSLNFIKRYIEEIDAYTYAEAPLEKMAYALDAHFANNGEPFDVPTYVQKNL